MSNFKDFVQDRLKPAIFDNADRVFSEMGFQRDYKGGWASRKKLDGSETSRRDKSVITRRCPYSVLEQGGDAVEVIDLYEQLHRCSFMDAVREIAAIVGLQVPEAQPQDSESYKRYRRKQEALERIAQQMRSDLRSEEGKETLSYLTDERGYRLEEERNGQNFIDFAEFGHVSAATADALRELCTEKEEESCYFPYGLGTTYTLAMPYRSNGDIKGFVFRSIYPDTDSRRLKRNGETFKKYTDAFISRAASKKYHLFGLTGLQLTGYKEKDKTKEQRSRIDENLTIVEGEIDALRALYYDIPNVVAASGGMLYAEALQEAKRKGVKYITLLFDREETDEKQKVTYAKIEKAIKIAQEAGLTTFVAELPTIETGRDESGKRTYQKQDTDSYLTEHTADELRELIERAETAYHFLFVEICRAGERRTKDEGETTDKCISEMRRGIKDLLQTIPASQESEKQRIVAETPARTAGFINAEALRKEADYEKQIADAARQREESVSALAEAFARAKAGRTDEALTYIADRLPDLRAISKEAEFSKLLRLPTANEIRRSYKERPAGVPTPYAFETKQGDKEQLILPTGALTFICAPTSHGKSRFLENLALYLAQDEREGAVLYFSFEEDTTAVSQQLLNIYANMELSNKNLRTIGTYYREGTEQYFKGGVSVGDFQTKEEEYLSLLESGKLRIYYEDYDSADLIDAIRYTAKNIKVKAVFIDYVQLLHKRGAGFQRKEELQQICREFMAMAVEERLPVVMAAQLNREAYSPLDMAVQNIAEASDIEHSANIVIMLWNSIVKPLQKNTYYRKNSEDTLTDEASSLEGRGFKIGQEGKLYAVVAKNRSGARNIDAVLTFNGNTGVIEPNYAASTETQQETQQEAQQELPFTQRQEPEKKGNWSKPKYK